MTRTLRIITALLTFQLFARGLDYATGNPHQGVGAFQVESLDPPIVWGTVCIIASAITTVLAVDSAWAVRKRSLREDVDLAKIIATLSGRNS